MGNCMQVMIRKFLLNTIGVTPNITMSLGMTLFCTTVMCSNFMHFVNLMMVLW